MVGLSMHLEHMNVPHGEPAGSEMCIVKEHLNKIGTIMS